MVKPIRTSHSVESWPATKINQDRLKPVLDRVLGFKPRVAKFSSEKQIPNKKLAERTTKAARRVIGIAAAA